MGIAGLRGGGGRRGKRDGVSYFGTGQKRDAEGKDPSLLPVRLRREKGGERKGGRFSIHQVHLIPKQTRSRPAYADFPVNSNTQFLV